MNNPLSATDPSGYRSFFSRAWHAVSPIAHIAASASNITQSVAAGFRGELGPALLGAVHGTVPGATETDGYIQRHPSLAPYVQIAGRWRAPLSPWGWGRRRAQRALQLTRRR